MVSKRLSFTILFSFIIAAIFAQPVKQGPWFGHLLRKDGKDIRFHFDVRTEKNKTVIYVINAGERLLVDKVKFTKDSVFIDMPVFESNFAARKVSAERWEGVWFKKGAVRIQEMPFIAETQASVKADEIKPAIADITGRWEIVYLRGEKVVDTVVGEWQQKGNTLRGTIMTSTGDYRYLSGVVSGDSMRLSTFDGSHAFLITAKLNSDREISGGVFYSGATGAQSWRAVKNENAKLPNNAAMYVRGGEDKLDFRFMDLNKKWVSINDPKFKNKVVIIQIMGSWCPNCMDETAFMSEYYRKNKQRGVEIIGLAYEYTTDFERSKKSIEKFRDRFKVEYTLLNTGVTVSDSLRTEKTLPQLTQIKSFPSTIFLDKTGKVARIHTGFEGPGTGVHYLALKKDFEETVDALLKK